MNNIIEASLIMNLLHFLGGPSVDISTLKEFCEGVWNIPRPSRNLLTRLSDYYELKGGLPDEIDDFSRWQITSCLCGAIFPEDLDLAVKACSYIIQNYYKIPGCQEVLLYLEYHKQENKFPDNEEFLEYLNNLRNISNDPDNFHQDNKVKIGVKNIESLQISKCSKEDNCGLCFDTIEEGEDCYLLPCKHIFHNTEEKCLSSTIKKWLTENKTCPICKTEVKL